MGILASIDTKLELGRVWEWMSVCVGGKMGT
jgi:hypothetical protein